jgi:hypothetical protein
MTDDPVGAFWTSLEKVAASVGRNKAVNINSQSIRDSARALAQEWFRNVRPFAAGLGATQDDVQEIDVRLQHLLRLSNGQNAKKSYVSTIRALKRLRHEFDATLERYRSDARLKSSVTPLNNTEARIIETLERMLPDAAVCYRQVLSDLNGPPRLSYRGTATELREVVREILDHLAPDKAVMQSDGFALEKDRKAPTMKQKARFILRARGLGETSRKAPEQAVELLEEQIASIARSVYERGSASTHGPASHPEVLAV